MISKISGRRLAGSFTSLSIAPSRAHETPGLVDTRAGVSPSTSIRFLAAVLFSLMVLPVSHVSLAMDEAQTPHNDHDTHHQDDEHDRRHLDIDDSILKEAGITTATAGPGLIERHVRAYGRLITPAEGMVRVQARFSGMVKSVAVNVGDRVRKNQVLAVIESNKSLQTYSVRAPITAVVQSRMINAGEITGDEALFTLINNDTLWAELKVFPRQRFEVSPGLQVHIVHNGHRHDSRIEHIIPASDSHPYVIARVKLDNSDGEMAPGDLVDGQIDAEKLELPLVIPEQALQTIEEQSVVFVRDGHGFEARQVETGRTDGRHIEVLSGLVSGEEFAVNNTYLLKADLLKSGAGHGHAH